MKKIISILVSLLSCLIIFSACSSTYIFEHFSEYPLVSAKIDENELDISSLYPDGAYIKFSDSGKGIINLGEIDCEFVYSDDNGSISAAINNLPVSGTKNDDTVILNMQDIGLTYTFSKNKIQNIEVSAVEETDIQKKWNGKWSGRLFFDNPTGIWSEYQYRSMETHGTVIMNADGNGTIILTSNGYSESEPALVLSVVEDDKETECRGGYLFSYRIEEGGASVKNENVFPDSIRTTVFIDPREYPWYADNQSDEEIPPEAEKLDCITINGKCISNSDSFDYEIVLIRENQ